MNYQEFLKATLIEKCDPNESIDCYRKTHNPIVVSMNPTGSHLKHQVDIFEHHEFQEGPTLVLNRHKIPSMEAHVF